MTRYIIQTEHIRGERRLYWVEDRSKKYGRGFDQVTEHTTDQRKAQRWCDKLNEHSLPAANRRTDADQIQAEGYPARKAVG